MKSSRSAIILTSIALLLCLAPVSSFTARGALRLRALTFPCALRRDLAVAGRPYDPDQRRRAPPLARLDSLRSLAAAAGAPAASPDQRGKKTMDWADWVEPDFPFFSSVLD